MRYLILSLMITSCFLITSPSYVPEGWEDIVQEEWVITHNDLLSRGVSEIRLRTVKKHHFSWKAVLGIFQCNDKWANGCYHKNQSLIRWNTETPSVLRHEIGHGILDKLGYSCWNRYQHDERSCP